MSKEILASPHAPTAIGPYSQGVRVGPLVVLSGQIPLDPATGQVVPGDTAAQTHRVLQNAKALLEASGLSLAHVFKATVFLKDLNEFSAMNGVYAEYFPTAHPARSTVEVARLPRDVRVEIELWAHADAA